MKIFRDRQQLREFITERPLQSPLLLFLTKQLPLRERDNSQANKNNKKKALLAFISLKTLEELGESATERVSRVSRL